MENITKQVKLFDVTTAAAIWEKMNGDLITEFARNTHLNVDLGLDEIMCGTEENPKSNGASASEVLDAAIVNLVSTMFPVEKEQKKVTGVTVPCQEKVEAVSMDLAPMKEVAQKRASEEVKGGRRTQADTSKPPATWEEKVREAYRKLAAKQAPKKNEVKANANDLCVKEKTGKASDQGQKYLGKELAPEKGMAQKKGSEGVKETIEGRNTADHGQQTELLEQTEKLVPIPTQTLALPPRQRKPYPMEDIENQEDIIFENLFLRVVHILNPTCGDKFSLTMWKCYPGTDRMEVCLKMELPTNKSIKKFDEVLMLEFLVEECIRRGEDVLHILLEGKYSSDPNPNNPHEEKYPIYLLRCIEVWSQENGFNFAKLQQISTWPITSDGIKTQNIGYERVFGTVPQMARLLNDGQSFLISVYSEYYHTEKSYDFENNPSAHYQIRMAKQN